MFACSPGAHYILEEHTQQTAKSCGRFCWGDVSQQASNTVLLCCACVWYVGTDYQSVQSTGHTLQIRTGHCTKYSVQSRHVCGTWCIQQHNTSFLTEHASPALQPGMTSRCWDCNLYHELATGCFEPHRHTGVFWSHWM